MAGLTRIYYNDTFAGLILKQIGFKRPPAQDKPEFADEVGKERIPEFDGDRLFYFTYETGDGGGDAQAADWTADPLWQNLDVVKAGKAYVVDDAIWNTSGSIIVGQSDARRSRKDLRAALDALKRLLSSEPFSFPRIGLSHVQGDFGPRHRAGR